ncbi:MAG: GDSL-type esterase/lipase family protein [Verrucomicrobiota bacterium]
MQNRSMLFLVRSCLSLVLTTLAVPILGAAPLVKSGETVAFLGDSITQFGAQAPGGYVRLVQSGFAANDIAINIVPAGVSGNKSNQMLERLESSVLEKKPAWMTLSCGVNDVWHSKNGRGIGLEDYKKNITEIVDRAEKSGVKVVILTSTLIGPKTDDELNQKAVPYNAFLRELAASHNLPLADLSAEMIKQQDMRKPNGANKQLTGDGVHMNYLGNIMMAEGVLRAFGLEESQLMKARQKWDAIPDAVTVVPKIPLSLPEMAALEALADADKKPVDLYISEKLAQSLRELLKARNEQP